jgi:tetratricopeptide (TPR) repeat protein
MHRILRVPILLLALIAPHSPVHAEQAAGEEEALVELASRQKDLLKAASGKKSQAELEDLRQPLQELCYAYEDFLKKYPKFALGYVSYAMLLDNPIIDERRRSTALFLKANQLDPNLPLVKNQLGNHVAEQGQPLEALNYFLAAVRLAPKEPLYHYQLGTLLAEARDDFLKSGEWTAAKIDEAMQKAFLQASLLTPGDWHYAYRYGLSFYDVASPDWEAALKFWSQFEGELKPGIEQQTCRVHRARALLKLGRREEALSILSTVTEPVLAREKEKLEAESASTR